MAKQSAPAAARNRAPIRAVLERVLPAHGLVLELASGSGEHAVYFAQAFPALIWQPSDPSSEARASIAAHAAEAGLANLRAPIALDASAAWPITSADAIVCINMIHISPWAATLGLFAGAAAALPVGGVLYTYGPYRFSGRYTADSNAAFDASLRARDERWGVRDLDDLTAAARERALELDEVIAMPANNHSLIFRRR